jgi:hypothetical protein
LTSIDPAHSDQREPVPASVADAVSGYVTELARVPTHELARWLPGLLVAAGWQVGRAEASTVQPTRIAVYRHQLSAGRDACETIDMFTFAGSPPVDIVRAIADCGLRALSADDIIVRTLHEPSTAPIAAMRSSGYFNVAGHQRIWAQSSIYIAGDGIRGLLVEQNIFVRIERLSRLRDDITQLTDALQAAFNQRVLLPHSFMERRDGPD